MKSCCGTAHVSEAAYLHQFKHKHGLTMPRAGAIELHNAPVKAQGLEDLNFLHTHIAKSAKIACHKVVLGQLCTRHAVTGRKS